MAKKIKEVNPGPMISAEEVKKAIKPRVKKPAAPKVKVFKPITKDSPMNEVLEHPQFKEIIEAQIRKTSKERADVLEKAGKGSRLRSDSFSVLDKSDSLQPERLILEYVQIMNKVSLRASRERAWISEFIESCAVMAMLHFEKIAAAEAEAKAALKKSRKPRTKKE